MGEKSTSIDEQGPVGQLLVRGKYRHDVVDKLTPWPSEHIITLHRSLLARGMTHLILAGVMSHAIQGGT